MSSNHSNSKVEPKSDGKLESNEPAQAKKVIKKAKPKFKKKPKADADNDGEAVAMDKVVSKGAESKKKKNDPAVKQTAEAKMPKSKPTPPMSKKKLEKASSKEPKSTDTPTVSEEDRIKAAELKKKKLKEKRKMKKQQKKALRDQSQDSTRDSTPIPPQVSQNYKIFKLTIRKLPPKLTEKDFVERVLEKFPDFPQHVREFYYVAGRSPATQYERSVTSRCYINCKTESSMMIVGRTLKGISFNTPNLGEISINPEGSEPVSELNEDFEVYTPIIEKSFYQEMPFLTLPKTLLPSNENDDGLQKDINPLMNLPSDLKIDKEGLLGVNIQDTEVYKLFCELLQDNDTTQLPANIFTYRAEYERAKNMKKQKELKALNALANQTIDETVQKKGGKSQKSKKKKSKKKKNKKAAE